MLFFDLWNLMACTRVLDKVFSVWAIFWFKYFLAEVIMFLLMMLSLMFNDFVRHINSWSSPSNNCSLKVSRKRRLPLRVIICFPTFVSKLTSRRKTSSFQMIHWDILSPIQHWPRTSRGSAIWSAVLKSFTPSWICSDWWSLVRNYLTKILNWRSLSHSRSLRAMLIFLSRTRSRRTKVCSQCMSNIK